MKTLKNIRTGYLAALAAVLILAMQFVGPNGALQAQVTPIFPNAYLASAGYVNWTAGTVNNGGKPVSVTAGSAAISTGRTSCAAPLFASCNILYASSAGTVSLDATSSAVLVANGAGNTILAYIETGNTTITQIIYPQQSNVSNQPGVSVLACGITVTCATPGATGSLLGTGAKIAFGSAATTAGSAAITTLPFTNSNTYGCVASLAATTTGAPAAGNISAVPSSGSAMTVTINGATGTTAIQYVCFGY